MKAGIVFLQAVASVSAAQALDCSIKTLQSALPANATVLAADLVPENGTYGQGAADIAYPTNPTSLPALCAVTVNVTSSSTSSFIFGLFLPTQWNDRFLALGNGGFAGGINWLDMGSGVGYGFASMSTDTGHNSTSGDGSWALDKPEKLTDWGWRAMHGSVVLAKELTKTYYGSEIKYSYYSGCSTGGRQGLKSAQKFPDDFDGVLVGAPAWWTTHLQTWTIKVGTYNVPATAAHHIPTTLFPVIAAEVLKQCDGADGLKDSIITDPRRCAFNREALLCGGHSNSSSCLTPAQLTTLDRIYADYTDVNQTFVAPALSLGSESQWFVLLGNDAPNALGPDYVKYFLQEPSFDWHNFDYSVVQRAEAVDPGDATADDFAALADFADKGGKLLHYHGWADALIPTRFSTHFHSQVQRALSARDAPLEDWYRFFLIPGMQHCSGTPEDMAAPWYIGGANQAGEFNAGAGARGVPGCTDAKHDALLALVAWVEQGQAVDQIVATKFVDETNLEKGVKRQRPICAWPKEATYTGEGDVNSVESWECKKLY
ncbi:uncharacterized protein K452DRAFT_288794 [Aplosporella prunicola CBS 121167]|uniref:Carboxylic ester hydrolase n=1 Tax=Aplosporella prunicola CBS 121167 TaxID=1176127 RepID=A0A6A6BBU8_9PEZI|nr:uncharacterized protein K452DRAFT_288794 [Aplosporella prunicola CBS 121167]KAF2140705.1 hypothetical protein K452DRAFT_288794 [Aplosporella prunicola CBS 121167]